MPVMRIDKIPGVIFGGIDGRDEFNRGAELLTALVGGGIGELAGQLKDLVVVPGGHG